MPTMPTMLSAHGCAGPCPVSHLACGLCAASQVLHNNSSHRGSSCNRPTLLLRHAISNAYIMHQCVPLLLYIPPTHPLPASHRPSQGTFWSMTFTCQSTQYCQPYPHRLGAARMVATSYMQWTCMSSTLCAASGRCLPRVSAVTAEPSWWRMRMGIGAAAAGLAR
jgi:hypothetical protein